MRVNHKRPIRSKLRISPSRRFHIRQASRHKDVVAFRDRRLGRVQHHAWHHLRLRGGVRLSRIHHSASIAEQTLAWIVPWRFSLVSVAVTIVACVSCNCSRPPLANHIKSHCRDPWFDIALNNASRSFAYFIVIQNQFTANNA